MTTSKKIEVDLKKKTTSQKKWKTTSTNLENGRRPQAQFKKSTFIVNLPSSIFNQSTRINQIGCDIIVN